MPRSFARLGIAVACIVALAPENVESASRPAPEQIADVRVLDVPYVPQSEALCGGASLAMVLRYWGERRVYAEDFSPLLDDELSGIRGDALMEEVRSRGWQALSFHGDESSVTGHLAKGRPLIALIEDRPGRYHYVVLIGYAAGKFVLHDPSVASFRVVDAMGFEAAWRTTGRWTLLVLPPSEEDARFDEAETPDEVLVAPSHSCSPLVKEGVRLGRLGDLNSAEQVLQQAGELCPSSSVPPRELAGVRLLQSRFDDAARLAQRAVARDPQDSDAWRILASSRFLMDDEQGALRAWSHTTDLEVDLTRFEGLTRTPHRIVAEQMDLPNGTLLTEASLRRAQRRLSELPTVSSSRVGYRPVAGGLAEIDVAVVERPLLTDGPLGLVAESLRALVDREVSVNVTNAMRRGERWRASWRWWEWRPRVSVSLAVPRPGGLPGIWHVEVSREEQTYGFGAERSLVREKRRHVGVSVGDWATADLRWEAAAGFDRWDGSGDYVSLGGAVERRLANDRLAFRAEGQGWFSDDAFARASLSSKWRSSDTSDGVLWLGRVGLDATSTKAPLDLWSGAGTGHAQEALLRAHPLLKDGIVDVEGGVFGRYLVHGGFEMQNWLGTTGPARWGVALFTDVAKSWRPLSGTSTAPVDVDVGAGLRLDLLGQGGTLRIDAARGLRDGNFALSAAWQMDWPN